MRRLAAISLMLIMAAFLACFPDKEEVQKLAEISKTKIALAKLSAALEIYNVEKGSYPENIKTLEPDYIPSTDIKDAWDNKILYQLDRKQGYRLTSPGPDGVKNTADDLICQNGEFIKPSSDKF
jgi:hypothetical protein